MRRLKIESEFLYAEKKDYGAVLVWTHRVLQWLPGTAWAHEARGLALLELKEEKEAVKALEMAVALDDVQSVLAMAKLVKIYRAAGREEEARKLAQKLERILRDLPSPGASSGKEE